ncbi:DUF1214 domain-containing protein [Brucella haematophila]|uniref:DUF1214 domain-containing protein n=1 Tax=Brucella haematophila TaxID=419474 RepID=UPI001AEE6745|nr:DUF1214 domain-containing protein [Brucella haematophila]
MNLETDIFCLSRLINGVKLSTAALYSPDYTDLAAKTHTAKQNSDGSTDIYVGSKNPGVDAKRIATIPDKGFFTILRRYGPTKAFFDKTWKPDPVVNIK